ncbi:phosphatidylserine decarboxylase [Campylobacter sp.]|uniref:phosphatidylserine decarboxylase n=1 Tax=Campylobacter sp. TaxID=205 RepID=UPI0027044B12|nr:phosphatidylserine decarboxylase [Campylobacter sp.]
MRDFKIIAKEGYKYLFIFVALFALSVAFGVFEWLSFILLLAVLFIFREPAQKIGSNDEYAILSPIGGKIKSIDKIWYFDTECTQIVISKSIFSSGSLRAPCDMNSVEFRQRHGLFLCSFMKAANFLNERALYICSHGRYKIAIRLVSGALSRNLYPYKFEGIKAGEKFGFMSDGTVTLILPANTRISVVVGERLKVSSLIGFFNYEGKR